MEKLCNLPCPKSPLFDKKIKNCQKKLTDYTEKCKGNKMFNIYIENEIESKNLFDIIRKSKNKTKTKRKSKSKINLNANPNLVYQSIKHLAHLQLNPFPISRYQNIKVEDLPPNTKVQAGNLPIYTKVKAVDLPKNTNVRSDFYRQKQKFKFDRCQKIQKFS